MSLFMAHRIEHNQNGITLILQIDESGVEFANEIGTKDKLDPNSIGNHVNQYITENVPGLKAQMVKILLGSLLITAIPIGAGTAAASTTQQQQTYIVSSGDSLFIIARRFNTTVDEIRRVNNITGDMIFIGQALLIPVTGTVVQTPAQQHQQNMTTSITVGSTGTQVELLQRNLKALGYFTYPTITGYFGQVTAQSVRGFQRSYQLPVTGVVDQKTLNEIQRAMVKRNLVRDASTYTGVPYRWGGATPAGFDCSGFIHYMFTKHGVKTTRTTSEALYRMGKPIQRTNLQPGDLVFYAVNEPGVISHVGFYIGNNQFISATSTNGIWAYSLDNSFWAKYYMGAKRVY